MKNFSKRITSLILALILTISIFTWTNMQKVSAAEPIKIGYSVSKATVGKGDTVEVKLFFKNYEQAAVECTAFEYDLYIDPTVFSVESAKIHFDGTGAMMNMSKYNESQKLLKNVYFNPGKFLPQNSTAISTFTLKVLKDFAETTDIELTVRTKIALDKDNNYFDVEYDTPVITCGPLSSEPSGVITESPAQTVLPTATPSIEPAPTGSVTSKTHTVTYNDYNGRFLWSETVLDGSAANDGRTPSRPGYVFDKWQLDKGSLDAVDTDITATAQYTKADFKYTIKVKNGSFVNKHTVVKDSNVGNVYESAQFEHDDCVIVEVDESVALDTSYFVGWTKSEDNTIVSYSKTYSFLATESCEVRAVYSSEEAKPVPTVVMFEHSYYMKSGKFSCERYIPSEYAYSGSGIILTNSDIIGTDTQRFVLEGDDTVVYNAQDSAVNAQFSVLHTDLSKKIYARAYLIYKTTDGVAKVVYSSVAVYDPNVLY